MTRVFSTLICLLLVCSALPAAALFSDYRYISAADLKQNLEQGTAMTLVDIQVEEEFSQHNIVGAVATYAYPVKSTADKAKLTAAIESLRQNDDLAVVVCPRGGGGAKRAYDHLVASGIAEERVVILSKGQSGWPYPELLTQNQ